ncbi:hypothetical protein [Parasphingorhabdus sp.]|uniref:hypothetical protein n=1 Tax=Parasphingorhabdus sp. TaxID=2709688 RepID=UPI003A933C8C
MPALEFVVKKILHYMPILFGLLFLGPLIAQSMDRLGWPAPPGLSTLTFGLIIGGTWGLFAFFRGSWIWARP